MKKVFLFKYYEKFIFLKNVNSVIHNKSIYVPMHTCVIYYTILLYTVYSSRNRLGRINK